MKRILGRVGDIPRVKGMFVPPRRVELVLDQYENIGRYQLLIDRPKKKDRLTIRIECAKEDQNTDLLNQLIREFKVALGILPGVEWLMPGTIKESDQKILDLRNIS